MVQIQKNGTRTLRVGQLWAGILLGFLLQACSDNSGNGGPAIASSTVPDAVVVSGTLVINADGDTASSSSSKLVQTREVTIQDSAENTVATAYTDEDGRFSMQLPGALAIDAGSAGLSGGSLTLMSLIEDDGQGKVLGVKETLTISKSEVASGAASLGSFPFAEVAAIKGQVRFVNADGTENPKLQKVGTEVFLPGYSLFAKTDKDGRFLILYVPAGDYTLRIEKGSLSHEQSIAVVQNTTLNLGTIDIVSDTDAPITTPSKDSTDFKAPMCVTLASSESTAKIYYSLDGSTPTATNPFLYSASAGSTCGSTPNCPICIQSRSTTLKFFAVDAAGNAEDLQSKFYFYNEKWADPSDTTAPSTSLSINGTLTTSSPSYAAEAVEVKLQANEGADIYYTTDGSAPTTASTLYTGPFKLDTTSTLRYFARDWAANLESVKTHVLRIYRWTRLSASSSVNFDTLSDLVTTPTALAYDSNRSKVMLVSHGLSAYYTYEWDGSAWSIADTLTPGAGDNVNGIAYNRVSVYFDSSKNVLVGLFGFCATGSPDIRSYRYVPDASINSGSGDNWQSLTLGSLAEAPVSGVCASAASISVAYSSGKNRAVIAGQGGSSGTNAVKSIVLQGTSGDSYSGSSWQAGVADVSNFFMASPTVPGEGRVVYMPNLSQSIYFGGGTGSDAATYILPDSQFDGSTPKWTKYPMAVFPHLRGADAVYMPSLGKVFAFGGYNTTSELPTNDGYLFDGTEWKKVAFANTSPSPRRGATMVYIPGTEQVMLFGGISLNSSVNLTDTWIFAY